MKDGCVMSAWKIVFYEGFCGDSSGIERENDKNMSGIRIGTRGSKLALRQAALVQAAIAEIDSSIGTELVVLQTRGDQIQDTPLSMVGDKGIFASELEQALLSGHIDLAVHSAKDLPMRLAMGLFIAAVLPRADVRDVLVVPRGGRIPIPAFGEAGAGIYGNAQMEERLVRNRETVEGGKPPFRIGTGSRRRQMLARRVWEDAICEEIRGNVDTRLKKLQAGHYDGILLAKAGLDRMGIDAEREETFDFYPLSPELFLPAACQGIIAVEAVQGSVTAAICKEISDAETELSYLVEREALAQLSADCSEAAAAWCRRTSSGPEAYTAFSRGQEPAVVRKRETSPVQKLETSSVGSLEAAYAATLYGSQMAYPEDSIWLDVMYAENKVRLIGAAEAAEGGRMARRAAKMVKKQTDWL